MIFMYCLVICYIAMVQITMLGTSHHFYGPWLPVRYVKWARFPAHRSSLFRKAHVWGNPSKKTQGRNLWENRLWSHFWLCHGCHGIPEYSKIIFNHVLLSECSGETTYFGFLLRPFQFWKPPIKDWKHRLFLIGDLSTGQTVSPIIKHLPPGKLT